MSTLSSLEKTSAEACIDTIKHYVNQEHFNSSLGGSFLPSQPIKLALTDGNVVSFPLDASGEKKLLEACVPASFGKGQEEVLDDTYRRALKLVGHDFFSSFEGELLQSDFLHNIQQTLSPDQKNTTLVAVKDKLNVYTKGGFFKAHRDTPRSNDLVGTLIVVLPGNFDGGELVVQNGKDKEPATFAWPNKDRLQYAAFFTDSEHEILEVKSGVRVSIAYSLISKPIEDQRGTEYPLLASVFQSHLQESSFLQSGGKFGYHCQHQYPMNQQQRKILPAHLKGRDAAIFSTAKLLGLNPEIYALWDCEEYDYEYDDHIQKIVFSKVFYGGANPYVCVGGEYGSRIEVLEGLQCEEPEGIIWLNDRSSSSAADGMYVASYGNEPSMDTLYRTAAIVLHVPAADDRAGPVDVATNDEKLEEDSKKRSQEEADMAQAAGITDGMPTDSKKHKM